MTDVDRGGERAETVADAADARVSLGELTRAAGVSIRTVRYYIAEGLLPPPVGAGPRSAYTTAHLDRLRLIGRMKTAYLPLKEIRRRLAGLSDAEVRRLLAERAGAGVAPPPPSDSASDYLDRVLGPRARLLAAPATPPAGPAVWEAMAQGASAEAAPTADIGEGPAQEWRSGPLSVPFLPEAAGSAKAATPGPSATEPEAWRRIPIGEDAELLIRESAYRRRRALVDWLVAWARRVFG
jgi:DNA-binding transcriptional MerR regulator